MLQQFEIVRHVFKNIVRTQRSGYRFLSISKEITSNTGGQGTSMFLLLKALLPTIQ